MASLLLQKKPAKVIKKRLMLLSGLYVVGRDVRHLASSG